MRSLLLVVGLLVATATAADARSLYMDKLVSDIQIRKDGAVVVQETLHLRFEGSWNGVFRVIPYGQHMGWYKDLRKLTVTSVTDDKGTPLEHEEDRKRGKIRIKIRVPGASNAARIVKIQYVMHHVILPTEDEALYGGMDKLEWNVTGDSWEMPIAAVEARVTLPDAIAPKDVRNAAYTGRYGGKARDYQHETTADGVQVFRSTRTLMPGENITVAVFFPPNVVDSPSKIARLGNLVVANWTALLPFLLFGVWFLFWWYRGRDPLQRTVIAEFEAPYDLRPTEVGTLIDDRMDAHDLTAAFVDLAVRGVITIEGSEKKASTVFELHPEAKEAADLVPWERMLLDKVFDDEKTRVTLAALRRRFPTAAPSIRRSVLNRLVRRKMYPKRPDKVYGHWNGMTLLALAGMGLIGFMDKSALIFWVLLVLAAIAMFVIARAMPRRTARGLDALARIKGLEDYLRTAEKERMASMPLATLERLLPYAIALGLHERWAEHMAGLYEGQPQWYHGPAQGWYWVDGLDGLNSGVRTSMVPISRVSSSSSGTGGWGSGWGGGTFSGGGGFSGGGFGGGGGGGW